MKTFRASTTIAASPESIWQELTNISQWPKFDPTLASVEGALKPSSSIQLRTKAGQTFSLKVPELIPNQKVTLSSGMPFGLFTGRRTYSLTPHSNGLVDFSMVENFSGLLAPLIAKAIPDLQPTFDNFTANLKSSAERK